MMNNTIVMDSQQTKTNMPKKLTMVETFVGCGGAHLGFKKNG